MTTLGQVGFTNLGYIADPDTKITFNDASWTIDKPAPTPPVVSTGQRETASFRCAYFTEAITDLGNVIEEAKRDLADVDFDTLVGTGFSGGFVIPTLAYALDKNFVLIRKETDDSHHGGGRLVGTLGRRWLFVDDFVGTGKTRDRVRAKVAEAATNQGEWDWVDGNYVPRLPFVTQEVGAYLYHTSKENKFHNVGSY